MLPPLWSRQILPFWRVGADIVREFCARLYGWNTLGGSASRLRARLLLISQRVPYHLRSDLLSDIVFDIGVDQDGRTSSGVE